VHYIAISGEWQEVAQNRARTKTYMNVFENKMSDLKLPSSIQDIIMDISPPPVKSLLED